MGKGWPRRNVALAIVLAGLAVPAGALAAFPGGDPAESPRANTPDDPAFDPCELDDVDTPGHGGNDIAYVNPARDVKRNCEEVRR